MAEDKRRGEEPRTVANTDPRDQAAAGAERAERARQAAAADAVPQNRGTAREKLRKEIEAGKPNLTQQVVEAHLQGVLTAAGHDRGQAKQEAAERAAEMVSGENDEDKV